MRLPILVLHICAGMLGLLSGAATISFRKGSRQHILAGNVFVVSMMGMSTAGAYLALMKHQMNNVFGGVLAFYLVTTAWGNRETQRRENEHFRLGRASGGTGSRNCHRELWSTSGKNSNAVNR